MKTVKTSVKNAAPKQSHKLTTTKEVNVKSKAKKSVKETTTKSRKPAPKESHPVQEKIAAVNVKAFLKDHPKVNEKSFKAYYTKQIAKPKGERDWSNALGITTIVRQALAVHFGLREQRA